MKIKTALVLSLKALKKNPMRAMLTTLGIIIGIASVITMMEIGYGSSESIKKSIASMGANSIIIRPGDQMFGGVSSGSGNKVTLTAEDSKAISESCPSALYSTPVISIKGQVVYGNKNWVPSRIDGATPDYLKIQKWDTEEGEPIKERDVISASKVCLIGKTVADNLFENESPVGKDIRIMNIPFTVTGVLKSKGANMMGMDQDDIILTPWTTLKYKVSGEGSSTTNQSSEASTSTSTSRSAYPSESASFYPEQDANQTKNYMTHISFSNIGQIIVSAASEKEVPYAIQEIKTLLRKRHNLTENKPDDFEIRSLSELSDMLSSTTKTFSNLLLSIAMISLLVGGVGIMNIMLVSVSERTREIGLRMAVGARQKDILIQFLTESVTLCSIGGFLGILTGHGASLLVNKLLNWPIATSIESIILSASVSISVGIIFGYYPAWKASKLDPIEALRYE